MKRKLIVHVGMGKTGSSSIQKTLRMAQPQLQAAGIKYLGLMLEHAELSNQYDWHHVAGWRNYLQQPNKEVACRQLSDAFCELDAKLPPNIKTLVWSNESLFDSIHLVEQALLTISVRMDIQVVGYIRRPDSWITSAYLQWGIKHKTYHGPMKPFRAWAKEMPYEVAPKIASWRSLINNTVFSSFDEIDDVSLHFLKTFLPQAMKDVSLCRENDTPSPAAMAMFAMHNSLYERQVLPSEIEDLLIRAGVMGKMQMSLPYNQLLPGKDDISEYINNNQKGIEDVNALLRSQSEPQIDFSALSFKDHSTNQNDINRALMSVIVYLSNQVEALRKQVENRGLKDD